LGKITVFGPSLSIIGVLPPKLNTYLSFPISPSF
jgi:hypothetical protein